MTTTETTRHTGFDAEQFEAFLATRDEPAWVTESRRRAFEAYRETLLVPLDPEEYKRVDLRTFRPEKFGIPTAEATKDAARHTFDTLLADRAEFAGHVTHVDGACPRANLDESLAKQGVLFGDLDAVIRERGDVLQPYFMTRAVLPARDRFSAWHAAFWTGGT